MSAVIRSTTRGRQPYVHKLRLEAQDGAAIQIPPAPLSDAKQRVLAKIIGAVLVGGVLLLLG